MSTKDGDMLNVSTKLIIPTLECLLQEKLDIDFAAAKYAKALAAVQAFCGFIPWGCILRSKSSG